MLTELQIVKMAWHEALRIWSDEDERLKKDPTSIIAKAKVEQYWNLVKELDERLLKLEGENV